ncbi:class I SAM-dependent methyltransferase [Rhizobiaceae bacterium n13]|uniref:Class I SAM-dependent methyltransferase n=1 Tax=Ferirhizobium litorale TaxID=2927786 RepID=A0AAE3QH64_9HYPH|nr:methyltransferase domain-containing protein [Fererhizobium litorale]MDI7864208.1 class I SAM-dependent methyltransferase [Fererhizobium litorale]MDI7925150.1 class I SAM-dependent methyltransferase [Fererhizobium litorale]
MGDASMHSDQTAGGANFTLRDEIKAYWSARAATFDLSPGHEIFSEEERAAWHALIKRHLGPGDGRKALDLASGTGVISHLMDDLGYRVTGIDWSEAMLERARAKAASRGRAIRFQLGDAESTLEADDSYDVIVTRHLVWTLVDPLACFREWLRVLKPGGRLLIIDGDFVNTSLAERLVKRLAAVLERTGAAKAQAPHAPAAMADTHESILSRVHFSAGARVHAVCPMLADAGFSLVMTDTNLRQIHKAQANHFGFLKNLARGLQHRYAIVAQNPTS